MSLWLEMKDREVSRDRRTLQRRHDDVPAAAPAEPRDEAEGLTGESEALFDIADFEAIANFAGIRRERPVRR